ncbi:MAG: hypothetical protein A2Y76_11610 [Planctomycetes bacterium RBG_13_60_9]|nr:MAG: hypothetical protein A2Y76_11610 [Planctomycetes bacterium RBG_13_60_9]
MVNTAIVLSLFLICESIGATYYVDNTGGSDQNSGLSPTTAWATITKANATMVAGDTVYIRAGTYNQVIRPANSGTAGNPITYKNYANEAVTVRGATGQIAVVNLTSSYIVVDGFTLKHIDPASNTSPRIVLIYGESYDHNTIRNCNIVCQGPGTYNGSREWAIQVSYADYCTIENNTISGWPVIGINIAVGATHAIIRGNTILNTQSSAIDMSAQSYGPHYALIEDNFIDFTYQEDGIQFEANYDVPSGTDYDSNQKVVIRNNVIRYCAENAIDFKGSAHMVIENNILYGIVGDNEGLADGAAPGMGAWTIMHGSDAGSRNMIIRNNVIYDGPGGILPENYYKIYNNTIIYNNHDYSGSNSSRTSTYKPVFVGISAWAGKEKVAIKNNIIGGHNSADVAIGRNASTLEIDGNLYFNDSGALLVDFRGSNNWSLVPFSQWPQTLSSLSGAQGCDVHSLETPPLFVNVPRDLTGSHENFDFNLQPGSVAIDAGLFLTQTTSSGQGTTIPVKDAGYFSDGYGVADGDVIQLAGQTSTARIVSVNYSLNTLTVDTTLSWNAGQGVSLPYHGATPDIGAREYGQTNTYIYSLQVSAVNGSVTKNPDRASYAHGETVTLQATPDAGYTFAGWSGSLTGTANPATLVMDSNKSVTANFTSTGSTGRTVGTTTVYSGISMDAPRRAVPFTMPTDGQLQSISIYHQAGSGQMILAVYGDNAGNPDARLGATSTTAVSNTTGWQTIPLQSPATVSAGQQIWLAWVFENHPGIRYATGTPGRADAGTGWSGGMPTAFGASTLKDITYSVYATYGTAPTTYTLTVAATNGTVTRTPSKTSYTAGESVTLQATPNSGYVFTGWSGALTGTTNPATLVMNSNKSVTANFAPATGTYKLTIRCKNGSVTRTPNQPRYASGERVTLQATPKSGYVFSRWSGDLSGSENPTTIVMDSDKYVLAYFVRSSTTYTLTTSATNGTVTKTPEKSSYYSGEAVMLQATPRSGYTFTGWSGALTGTLNPARVVVDANKSVTANFAPSGTTASAVNASEAQNSAVAAEAVEPMAIMDDAMMETPAVGAQASETAAMPEMPGLPSISDGQGNTWAIWQAGDAGQQQIFISRAPRGVDTVADVKQLSSGDGDHCSPTIARDAAGVFYAVWQENVGGDWDVRVSVSPDGRTWSVPELIVDSNANQTSPAISVGEQSQDPVTIVWQDDRAGSQNVYMAISIDAFTSSTVVAVTSDEADQTDPAMFINSEDALCPW